MPITVGYCVSLVSILYVMGGGKSAGEVQKRRRAHRNLHGFAVDDYRESEVVQGRHEHSKGFVQESLRLTSSSTVGGRLRMRYGMALVTSCDSDVGNAGPSFFQWRIFLGYIQMVLSRLRTSCAPNFGPFYTRRQTAIALLCVSNSTPTCVFAFSTLCLLAKFGGLELLGATRDLK